MLMNSENHGQISKLDQYYASTSAESWGKFTVVMKDETWHTMCKSEGKNNPVQCGDQLWGNTHG